MEEPKRRGPFGRQLVERRGSDRRGGGQAFGKRSPLRSFALGGLVGAAGAIATVRRLRRPTSRAAAGLAAFEDAPCFRELVERDAAVEAVADRVEPE
jgi:hypothetical protein